MLMAEEKYDKGRGLYYDHSTIYKKEPDPFESAPNFYATASQGEPYHGTAWTAPVAKERVNHPAHYNAGKIEVIDAICDWELDFIEGNVVKYVTRAKHKGDELGDLKKARWYLDYMIKSLEKQDAT